MWLLYVKRGAFPYSVVAFLQKISESAIENDTLTSMNILLNPLEPRLPRRLANGFMRMREIYQNCKQCLSGTKLKVTRIYFELLPTAELPSVKITNILNKT